MSWVPCLRDGIGKGSFNHAFELWGRGGKGEFEPCAREKGGKGRSKGKCGRGDHLLKGKGKGREKGRAKVWAPAKPVHVKVSTVSADKELEFDVPQDSQLFDIKWRIAALWQLPPSAQRLLCGPQLLTGNDRVGSLKSVGDDKPHIHLTLVVSLNRICHALEHGQGHERLEALRDLCRLGPRGGSEAIAAAGGRLEDPDFVVRWEAAEALMQVAGRGARPAVDAIIARMTHQDWHVRRSALEALGHVADAGDGEAVAAAAGRVEEDEDVDVRLAGLWALTRLATAGDEAAIAAAKGRAKDSDGDVRDAAQLSLRRLQRPSAAAAAPGP